MKKVITFVRGTAGNNGVSQSIDIINYCADRKYDVRQNFNFTGNSSDTLQGNNTWKVLLEYLDQNPDIESLVIGSYGLLSKIYSEVSEAIDQLKERGVTIESIAGDTFEYNPIVHAFAEYERQINLKK